MLIYVQVIKYITNFIPILFQYASNSRVTNSSRKNNGLHLLTDYNVLKVALLSKLLFKGQNFADFVTAFF
jgi:hypothetical protein